MQGFAVRMPPLTRARVSPDFLDSTLRFRKAEALAISRTFPELFVMETTSIKSAKSLKIRRRDIWEDRLLLWYKNLVGGHLIQNIPEKMFV